MGVRLRVRSLWASRSESDAVYEFDQARIVIGRGRGADVRLPHRAVGLRHATIEHGRGRYAVIDHGSTNGTLVSGARLVHGRPKPLREDDRIEIGGFALVFQSGVPVVSTTSSERTASLARRLVREAREGPAAPVRPRLTIINGSREGQELHLPEAPARLRIGRGEECELVLEDGDASREHAELEVSSDGVLLRDLGSKNGTFVNDRPVERRLLDDGDEIRIGSTLLCFDDPAAEWVEALENGEDEVVETPTFTDVEPEPEAEEPEDAQEMQAPESGRAARRARSGSVATADLVIYVLASVVFAVSVLGLVWLLRSG